MHELLARRLKRKRIGHVLFHGGVESSRRKTLVVRFREDDSCRVFLATDAGGVGLNLQHASVVINMDVPWNPAVLEQRIGRVHRLGQKQPVRVVNFIAQGTIEEGMLSVLKFKKSLFAGVLDGGASSVFLGGSRLARFMEAVEKTTTAIAEPVIATTADPWAALMQTGVMLLEQVAAASRTSSSESVRDGLSIVQRDPGTGQDYLRIPMPSAEVLDRALTSLGEMLGRFKR
jgi:superfamily II DNA/RNA helicase